MKKIVSVLAAAVASVLFARDMPINNGVLVNDLDADGNCIRNVSPPSRPGDAANKGYVDSHAGGVDTNAVREIIKPMIEDATNDTSIFRAPFNDYGQREFTDNIYVPPSPYSTWDVNAETYFYNVKLLQCDGEDLIQKVDDKADKPIDFDESHAGNLASLTADGNLADSGFSYNDFAASYEGNPSKANGAHLADSATSATKLAANDGTPDLVSNGERWGTGEGMLAYTSEIPNISETDPTFTNAVLQTVIPNLPTNITAEVYIAATNACANLGIDPALIPQGGTLGTVGGLLVALAAAVALLRKKTKLLKSDGTAEDDFAADLLGKQVAISAMKYGIASTSATVKAADRTVTKVTLGTTAVTVTFPDADENGKTRDFLLRIDAANLATGGSLTITKPTGATIYGDAFPSPEATKQYLVAITETAANEFYVRTIEITIPTEA